MSAERNLSPTEYELLSAYIDGELTDAEQQALQERLASDPILQRELDSLRVTVSLINLVPEMTVPRNFTLTEAMVTPQNVVQFRSRPIARSAYVSLVASVVLMLFGAIFMFSEIGFESTEASFTMAGAQSAPVGDSAEIALLPTETPLIVEQQAERALIEPTIYELETIEEAPQDVPETASDAGIFLTVPVDADTADDGANASSGIFLEAEDTADFEAETADEAYVEPPQVSGAGGAIMADESPDSDADMADNAFASEEESFDESDDVTVDDPEPPAGTNLSAPTAPMIDSEETTETQDETDDRALDLAEADDNALEAITEEGSSDAEITTQTTLDEAEDDGVADLVLEEAETETTASEIRADNTVIPTEAEDQSVRRDSDPTPIPSAPPSQSSDPITIGAFEIGIGLLIGGLLLMIVSFGLFRRNRS